jgi:ferric-dicitrate binding protein FerR (iron transport regulator)
MSKAGAGSPGGDSVELSDDELPWELLDGYFAGTATRSDRARVTGWIDGIPERHDEIEAIRLLWSRGAREDACGPRWDTARAVASLERQLAATRSSAPNGDSDYTTGVTGCPLVDPKLRPGSRWASQRRRLRHLVGLAAAAVVGIGVGTAWRLAGDAKSSESVQQVATAPQQRAQVTLRDGTTLTLGPASRLRISADFGRKRRVLELDGEALFTVVHDPNHPFEIHTARTVVHDVGTTFDVLAYASDSIERIVVIDGQVSVGGASLASRDVGTLESDGRLTLRHNTDVRRLLLWSEGGLTFADTPLIDAVHALQRTYDLRITLRDPSLGAQRVTASFGAGTPVDVVLHDVTAIIGATYRHSGQSIVIERHEPPATSH